MGSNKRIKNLFLFVVNVLVTALLLGGCSTSEVSFPEFTVNPSVEISTSETTINEDEINITIDTVPHITVALPYSDDTVYYLGKLFYLKQSNNLGTNTTGATINFEYLDGVDTPFIIDSIQTSSTGASLNTINSWNQNGGLPDLFLSNDLKGVYDEGYITSIDEFLFDNSLLSSSASVDALYECGFDNRIYGIPYGFSFDLLFSNIDYLPTDIVEEYAIKANSYINIFDDLSDLNDFVLEAFTYNNPEENEEDEDINSIISLRSAYKMILNSDESNSTEIDIIKSWYELGIASEYDMNNSDPVYSRNAVMWIADSSEIDFWTNYYPEKICFFRIPGINGEYKPFVTVYPMCISDTSGYKSFASDFASFIAFDEDAHLLITRLEENNGIYPMVDYYSVWNVITSNNQYGNIARSIEQQLDNMRFSSNVIDNVGYSDSLMDARNQVIIIEEEVDE